MQSSFNKHKRAIAEIAFGIGVVILSAFAGAIVAYAVAAIQLSPRLNTIERRVEYLGDVLVQQSILISQLEARECRAVLP